MLTTVQDILRIKGPQVWSISPETTVIEALQILAEKQIGALLVLQNDDIVGVVSERDFVRGIALEKFCELERPVSEVMTCDVVTISPNDDIEDCMQVMTEEHIRHLPVVDDGKLIGLVSIGDVVKAMITSREFTIEQLQKFIEGGGYNQ
jgi:CBS domain-containing protein